MLKEASLDEYVAKPGYYYSSPADWQRLAQDVIGYAADAVRDGAAQGIISPDMAAAEADHLRAACACWRLTGTGRQVEFTPIELRNEAQAEALRPYLRRRGRIYAALIRAMPDAALYSLLNGGIVLSKGKGSPLFVPGSDVAGGAVLAKLAFDAFSAKGGAGIAELAEYLAPGGLGLVRAKWRRIQGGGGSPVTSYSLDRDGWLTVPKPIFASKVRDIKASPFIVNALLAPMAATIKWCQRLSRHSHDGSVAYADSLFAARGSRAIAVDFKTFDDTVSVDLRRVWREEIMGQIGDELRGAIKAVGLAESVGRDVSMLIDAGMFADEWSDDSPLLSPPRSIHEDACIVNRVGGISSGEYDTSSKGNDIAGCIGEMCLDVNRLQGCHINQSDDQLYFSEGADAITRTITGLGMKATNPEDVAYLMRRIPGGYMFLGRALAGVINSEVQTEPKNWSSAVAGVALRRHSLRGHPLAAAFDCALAQHPATASVLKYSYMDATSAARLASAAGGGSSVTDRPGEEYAQQLGLTAGEAEDMAQLIDAAASRSTLPARVVMNWKWKNLDGMVRTLQERYRP